MIKVDREFLQEFEAKLDTRHPEKGEYAINMLGFREISIVVEVLHGDLKGLALKRSPIFDTVAQVEQHIKAYNEYNRILRDEIGLNFPDYGTEWVYTDPKKKKTISLYCIQKKHDPKSVCHHLIHQLSHKEEIEQLVLLIMKELHKVFKFNQTQDEVQVGIDGQISNWILDKYEVSKRVYETSKLLYIDTSTPMVKINGKSMMDGGGTLVLEGNERFKGPGHNSVLSDNGKEYLVYHTYDTENRGRPVLQIRPILWQEDGWLNVGPVLSSETDAP